MANCIVSDSCRGCAYNAKCVIYKGPNLPNISTYTYDNLQEILININEALENGGGSVTGAQNIGAGEGIFAQDSGGVLQFKSLLEGTGIIISSDADEITITLDHTVLDQFCWSLVGNSSTIPGPNFLGTTDTQPLAFKTNNNYGGLISRNGLGGSGIVTAHAMASFGEYAGETLIGLYLAGSSTGRGSAFFGPGAGRFVGAQFDNPSGAVSSENTFIGQWSGFFTQTNNTETGVGRNVGLGQSTLFRNVSGSDNTAIGTFALEINNKGRGNTAVGRDAMRSNIDGYGNAAFGGLALLNNSTGILEIEIDDPGENYTTATVTISAPYLNGPGTCYQVATAIAIIENGQINSIEITNPGCGYSSLGGTMYPGFSHPPVVVTITGDGTGASATAVLTSGEYNTGLGANAGASRRFGIQNLYAGYNAGNSIRYYDENTTLIGAYADVDSSVDALDMLSNATAIGYNAKVGNSNSLVLGATGAYQPNVGIGVISPTSTFHLVGNFRYVDGTEGAGKILTSDANGVATWEDPVAYVQGSGTLNYIPRWTPDGVTLGDSWLTQDAGSNSIIRNDDSVRGTTTTNGFLLLLRNSYPGDASSSATPMLYVNTTATTSTQKYGLRVTATSMPTSSQISNYIGRATSIRDVYLQTFTYIGTGSTGNYLEEQFHSVPNLTRLYASGNKTIGSSITSDNGYKLQVGGTTKIDGTFYLESVANDDTETKFLVWNSTTKDVEYRTYSSLGNYINNQFASAQTADFWVKGHSRREDDGSTLIERLEDVTDPNIQYSMTHSENTLEDFKHRTAWYRTATGDYVPGIYLEAAENAAGAYVHRLATTQSGVLIATNETVAGTMFYAEGASGFVTRRTASELKSDLGIVAGVTTLAAIGSSPNANGATISGSTLNLEPADGSFGGVVTTGTQTFAGVKTLTTPNFVTGFTISAAAASRKMMVGNGTNFIPSTETWAVPGTSGNVLTSDGTNWTSAPPAAGVAYGTNQQIPYMNAGGTAFNYTNDIRWDNSNKDLYVDAQASQLHGIILNGTNIPAIQFQVSGATRNYVGMITSNGAGFTGSLTGDLFLGGGGSGGYRVIMGYSFGQAPKFIMDANGVAVDLLLTPVSDDGSALGTTSLKWSDLFLASGAVINFNSGNATITHSASLLTSNVDIVVPDEAYNATTWDGNLEVPTKNAIRDKIESLSGGLTWTEVTGTSQAAAVNNGYIANNAGLVTITIPSTAAVGSIVRVAGSGAGGWRIAQNASEIIHFGSSATTTGTGGSLDSTNRYDAVELVCIVADTEWAVISSQGSITVV